MNVGEQTDSFIFWETNKNTLPKLYDMAVKFLIIPASSASVERSFSLASYSQGVKHLRSSLKDNTLAAECILKYNKHLFE